MLNAYIHHPLGRINSAVSDPFVSKPQEDSVFLCDFLLLPDDSQSIRAMKVDAVQIDSPGKKNSSLNQFNFPSFVLNVSKASCIFVLRNSGIFTTLLVLKCS